MNTHKLLANLTYCALTLTIAFPSLVTASPHFEEACTPSERALGAENLPSDIRAALPVEATDAYLSQNLELAHKASDHPKVRPSVTDSQTIHRFSQLLTLRRFAKSPESRLTLEYLLARTFFKVDQLHLAAAAMTQIASLPPTPQTVGLSLSALECLLQIHRKQPSFQLPATVLTNLVPVIQASRAPGLQLSGFERTLQEAAIQAAVQSPRSPLQTQLLGQFKGTTPAERLLQGIVHSSFGRPTQAVQALQEAIPGLRPEIGTSWLTKYEDSARILLARAQYTLKDYKSASAELLKIKRSSNLLADALGELAWANLQAGQHGDAVGNARVLQAGNLKNTFTPEAPMIIAMTFNELCQYPQSLHAVKTFRNRYEESYRYLASWSAAGAQEGGLYRQAVQFLKNHKTLPMQVGTEWIRSPLFQSAQREINLTMEERERIQRLNKTAGNEVIHLMESIIELAQNLKPRMQLARMKLKGSEALPAEIQRDLGTLRGRVVHLRRLQAAAQPWRRIVGGFQAQSKGLESRLVARINKDLAFRSHRMVSQLEEIQENLQFIEIEIFSGASQDLVWKNANPDYKQASETFKQQQIQAAEASAQGSWKWGSSASDEEGAEVWEDELGSHTANLADNCSNREKYLALQKLKLAQDTGGNSQ